MLIGQVIWNPDEVIADLGFFELRYYSLCFALAFASCYFILKHRLRKLQVSVELLDTLTVYVFIGTLTGARLAHCLFYDFSYFSEHPLEIFLPVSFEPDFHFTGYRGLASHGGGVGIILSLLLFSRKYRINLWFLLDQISLVVPLAGFFIRIGNLMNSEIIGKPANVPWAFIFVKEDRLPRHPAQLYEAFSYLLLFWLLQRLAKKQIRQHGYYFGLLFVLLFTIRILIEFVKEVQSSFESNMILDMGQLLSVPFIIVGMCILFSKRKLMR